MKRSNIILTPFTLPSYNGDISDLVHALNTEARAKGMKDVTDQAGVLCASLYKLLAENSNPHLKTMSKVAEVVACKLIPG